MLVHRNLLLKKTKVVQVTTKLKHKFQSVIKCFFPFSLFSLPRYPSLLAGMIFNCFNNRPVDLYSEISLVGRKSLLSLFVNFLLAFFFLVFCLFVWFFFHDITSFGKVNYAQARDPIIRAISWDNKPETPDIRNRLGRILDTLSARIVHQWYRSPFHKGYLYSIVCTDRGGLCSIQL